MSEESVGWGRRGKHTLTQHHECLVGVSQDVHAAEVFPRLHDPCLFE